jgi:hypothetical protein
MVDDKLFIGKVEEHQKCVYLKSKYKSKKTIKIIFFLALIKYNRGSVIVFSILNPFLMIVFFLKFLYKA